MKRLRQFRITQEVRDKAAEVMLKTDQFIYPLFIVEGLDVKKEISSMKGVFHYSPDRVLHEIEDCLRYGLNKFLLFGVIDEKLKDEKGSAAYQPDNLIAKAIAQIKLHFPKAVIFTDICLCAYTNHGHCGLINNSIIDNDSTLPLLAQMALTHAQAGADFVAPSAMMDGQVAAIRNLLDSNHYLSTKIMAYSVKYSSNFYGPFRDAAQSSPSFGNRKTYQMDYRTISQAIQEAEADIEEGAEWIMVKPAHTYLDMIHSIKNNFKDKTLAAYHVSGEYMMIKAAFAAGYIADEHQAFTEVLTAIKRAGADIIISYYAKELARTLMKNQ